MASLSNEVKKRLAYERQTAVRNAWKEEKAKVESGYGTRNWSKNEREELIQRGSVAGYQGHHMKSVSLYPENPTKSDIYKQERVAKIPTVAILYICLGKYDILWKDFYLSSEEYLLTDCEKFYYIFTDSEQIFQADDKHVIKIFQKDLGWPDNTLMRFHFFESQRQELGKYDYLFFFNANCIFVDTITANEFLPLENDYLFVNHPGYYNKTNMEYTYERNSHSQAFIPIGKGSHYLCGGINGGKSNAYLEMVAELRKCVDIDKEAGIIASVHDESHLNRFAFDNRNYKLLCPSYFFPQGWNGPFPPKIVAREKSIYFNIDKLKNRRISLKHRIKHLLRRLTGRMVRF